MAPADERSYLRFLKDPKRLVNALSRSGRALLLGGPQGLATWLNRSHELAAPLDYSAWIEKFDKLDPTRRALLEWRSERLRKLPPISLAPEPITDPESLAAALGAAQKQIHKKWELLLSARPGASAELLHAIEEASDHDPRVRWLGQFPERAAAWSAAIDAAQGSHLALLGNDAALREQTLLFCAEQIIAIPTIELLYADHDLIAADGARREPFFKPRFDPELAWSIDLFGPFTLIRTELARGLKLRDRFAPAEDFELFLRASEHANIVHLPQILSHRRDGVLEARALQEKNAAQTRAVADHLQEKWPRARVQAGRGPETRRIELPLPEARPLISAIIPTRDGAQVLRRCVEGLFKRTDWKPLELLIVDNGSRDPETLRFLEELEGTKQARVLRDDSPFNFSALNNRAARVARGELLALLNDDLEIIEPGWLGEMAVHALRPEIGAVGARLLYPDGRVQHAGIATGVLGLAGHLLRGIPRDDAGPNSYARLLRGSTAVTAACLVLRRELFLEAGGFDEEDLTVAFNDVDLCLRLGKRGLRNLYVPTAELIHHESFSRGSDQTPEKRERFAREVQTMLLRWPALANDPLYSPNLSLATEQMQPGPPRL